MPKDSLLYKNELMSMKLPELPRQRVSPILYVVIKAKPVFDSIIKNHKSVFVPIGFGDWRQVITIQNRLSVALRWLTQNKWPSDEIPELGKSLYTQEDYIALRGNVRIFKEDTGCRVSLLSSVKIERVEAVQFIHIDSNIVSKSANNIKSSDIIQTTPVVPAIQATQAVAKQREPLPNITALNRLKDLINKHFSDHEVSGEILVVKFSEIVPNFQNDIELEEELEQTLRHIEPYLNKLDIIYAIDREKSELRCIQ